MAAPEGNQFWKLRSKHGRDKLFASPELLWEAACEYFQWCEDNPLIHVGYRNGKKVEIPRRRVFTIHHLCTHIGCNTAYFRGFKSRHPNDSDFLHVIDRIENVIYDHQFVGACVGEFHPRIIARSLGLATAKVEQVVTPEYIVKYEIVQTAEVDQLSNSIRV